MEITFIYALVDPRDGQIKYIGKSNNPHQRLFTHYCDKRANPKLNWLNKLKSLNLRPEVLVLDKVLMSEWQFWEEWWYDLTKSWGYKLKNSDKCGKGVSYQTETTRKNISKGNLGKKFSQKHKDKISETRLNFSQEKKERICQKRKDTMDANPEIYEIISKKISKYRAGYVYTDDHKHNISKGIKKSEKARLHWDTRDYKGEKNPKFRGEVYQYSKDKTTLIKVWDSLVEITGYGIANISGCIRGNLKSAYGYYWTRQKLN
jgi:hypothetical protein